jgi:hypothetical protein
VNYVPVYARFEDQRCELCERLILRGDHIAWAKGQPVRHWWCHEKTALTRRIE